MPVLSIKVTEYGFIMQWVSIVMLWLFAGSEHEHIAYCLAAIDRSLLTHWGWATHMCIRKLISIGSDNGLSPGQRQAIIWTNVGILLIGPLETNFC